MPKSYLKILLADDDEISLQVLARHLCDASYIVVTANNGREAWEILQQQPQEFSLVLADRIMPYIHGIDLLKHMQAHSFLKTIPVIFLTGIADKEDIIEAVKTGVYDFLYKPIEKELLLAVVKKALLHKNRE